MWIFVDITECSVSVCSGNGQCVEVVGGGTQCLCDAGYTSSDCSVGKSTSHRCMNSL